MLRLILVILLTAQKSLCADFTPLKLEETRVGDDASVVLNSPGGVSDLKLSDTILKSESLEKQVEAKTAVLGPSLIAFFENREDLVITPFYDL